MGEIFNDLDESDQVIVPTDKTNSFISLDTKNMTMVNEHLRSLLREIDRDKAGEIFEKAKEFVDYIRFQL